MYITDQDIINYTLSKNAPLTDAEIIRGLVETDRKSEEKKEMTEGHDYYTSDHDILNENFTEYKDKYGETKVQDNKANNKLVHSYHRLLVMQKVSYLLNNPIVIEYDDSDVKGDKEDKEPAKSDKVISEVQDILGKNFSDSMIRYATGASNKGREWLYVYIDSNGNFKYMVVDARQIIPIYDTSIDNKLTQLIRYYKMYYNNAGDPYEGIQAQWWDANQVRIYDQNKDGSYSLSETKGHFKIEDTQFNTKDSKGWGVPPFIELQNNEYLITDLKPIKSLIDAYDRGESVIYNNLEDIQEAIITVTGAGDNAEDVRDNLRNFKVVVTGDENTKIDSITIEIPHEARDRTSKNTEENIFTFGMGINPKTDKFGQNPSGVALAWMYLPLDLKAGLLERKFDNALYELMWFINEFQGLTNKKGFDVEKFSFTFNKSMIANESEQIKNVESSKGTVSSETALANHPWVDDPAAEKEKIQQEQENEFNSFRTELDNKNGEGNDQEE